MLVNMSAVKNRQSSMSTNRANGTFASINGIAMSINGIFAAFIGMFASNFIYGSPTSVSNPWYKPFFIDYGI